MLLISLHDTMSPLIQINDLETLYTYIYTRGGTGNGNVNSVRYRPADATVTNNAATQGIITHSTFLST